jgi:hypothetical protein
MGEQQLDLAEPGYSQIVTQNTSTIVTVWPLILTQDTQAPAECFQVPPNTDLKVFGDEVTIRGRLQAQGKTIKIFARVLKLEEVFQEGKGPQPAELNVDGENGAKPSTPQAAPSEATRGEDGLGPICNDDGVRIGDDPRANGGSGTHGKQGDPGDKGRNGGSIFLVCDSFSPADTPLILSAKGGCGGEGQQGQNGAKGGDGGNSHMEVGGGNGGNGGNGGPGGPGGAGGKGGRVVFRSVNEKNLPGDKIVSTAGRGSKGSSGKGGTGGPKGKGGLPGGSDGNDGVKGTDGPDGSDGADGQVERSLNATYPELKAVLQTAFGDSNNTIIDPTVFGYFQMMFERARTRFLASNYEEAQRLLAWINNVFPTIPLDSASDDQIESFTDSVVAMKKSLDQKLDYYGNAWNQVPPGSLEFYEGQLNAFLTSFQEIEQRYESYMSASRNDQERHSDYVTALEKTKSLCDKLVQERDNTQQMIKQTVADINATETEIEGAKRTLLETITSFSQQINDCFSLPSAEQLAGVLLNLSFMPEKQFARAAMIGSQSLAGASDLIQSLSKVKLDDGTEIEKSLVINRLDVIGRDIANLSAGYTVSQKFIQKDAGVYRIIQKAEEFDQLCNKFYRSIPKASEAQTSMDNYVGKINYRNAKIDEYNALWARLGDLQGQLSKINADKDSKAIELARSEKPILPHRVAAFDNLYSRARDTGLKYLYRMGRAYSFWALKPYDELTTVCKLFDPDSIDHTTLKNAMQEIKNDCASEIESVYATLRKGSFPDEDADRNVARGITVTLTKESHPDFIESLKDEGIGRFELPTTHKAFGGMVNVRLTKVRAWIHGLKTGKKNIHVVIITHCGPESILTTKNKPINFQHDTVTVVFRYDASVGVENPKAIFAGQGAPHDGVLLDKNYAPIGPFTHWRLAILEDNNPDGLDRNEIEKVVMEFHIIAQTLEADTIDGTIGKAFIGTWEGTNAVGLPFEITLSGDGAAKASRGEDGTDGIWKGTWKKTGKATVVITWTICPQSDKRWTDWTTTIAKAEELYKKIPSCKGQLLPPLPTTSIWKKLQ